MITKRDKYIMYITNTLFDHVVSLRESFYDTDIKIPISKLNEIISLASTLVNQLEEQ